MVTDNTLVHATVVAYTSLAARVAPGNRPTRENNILHFVVSQVFLVVDYLISLCYR